MPSSMTLPLLLKKLNLRSMIDNWELLQQQGSEKGWSHGDYLAALCEQEIAERYQKRIERYRKESQLPPGKTLSTMDFSVISKRANEQINLLGKTFDWVDQCNNVLLFGPSGVGKTHMASAIGCGLIEQNVRGKFFNATKLVQHLQQARRQLQLEFELQRLDKFRFLIIDDLGYVRKDEQETQVLFELIAHRYETGSLIITSNRAFADWDQIFPDEMMTVAAVDRLIHHGKIISIDGDSYRRKEAEAAKQQEGGK